MKGFIRFIARSLLAQIFITCVAYAFYALLMGISLMPSCYVVASAVRHVAIAGLTLKGVLFLSVSAGVGVYLYFVTGIVVMGATIRILSLGIRPGTYPMVSVTMLRWLIYSGVYHIAGTTILDYVPVSFFIVLFFKLLGARIGRNVHINTWNLNDAYLIEIGDNVVIGGETHLSGHTFEKNCLILGSIKIGEGTLLGTRCYINPGVTIGKGCTVGVHSFVRKNKVIPDGTTISSIAGMNSRDAAVLEKSGSRLRELLARMRGKA